MWGDVGRCGEKWGDAAPAVGPRGRWRLHRAVGVGLPPTRAEAPARVARRGGVAAAASESSETFPLAAVAADAAAAAAAADAADATAADADADAADARWGCNCGPHLARSAQVRSFLPLAQPAQLLVRVRVRVRVRVGIRVRVRVRVRVGVRVRVRVRARVRARVKVRVSSSAPSSRCSSSDRVSRFLAQKPATWLGLGVSGYGWG